ncbi:MAG: DUF4912 domain-containing protein [Thermoguttaceae bacterium]
MINIATLKNRSVKDLAEMAKKKKVLGWHAMRKEELVQSLARLARAAGGKRNGSCTASPGHNGNGHAKHLPAGSANSSKAVKLGGANGTAPAAACRSANKRHSPHFQRRLHEIKARLAEAKDLSFRTVGSGRAPAKDRLVVMVRDPFWLHAYWELSRRSIERAQAAMGQHWHAAGPILRVHQLSRNGSASRQAVRDIAIHGGVNTWYIDVQDPPRSYQLELGYAAPGGRFFCLARSNVVSTPAVDTGNVFDRNWAEVAKDCDRIYAMTAGSTEQEGNGDLKEVLEERLHRPMGDPAASLLGPGAAGPKQQLPFCIDTELIVHGVTHPGARVTLRGEPVRLRPDGSFAVRFNLPDRRHVLPLVASSGDGAQQRTIVLAVDRNTKIMEPILREPGD